MRYTFGTNETAEKRLETISRVFNPYSSEFIKRQVKTPVTSAMDLGCGPGFTTHMLFMALQAGEIYGLDNSESYIIHAMNRVGHCVFLKHDLTKTPFPVTADIMYSRFVLSHLANPVEMINRWTDELNPSGIVLIEELEDINTDIKVFKDYLKVNEGLIASQGADIYVGKTISKGSYLGDVIINEEFEIRVSNSDAASMFYPNTMSIWENEGYVLENTSDKERGHISDEIKEIMDSKDEAKGITWKMRRIAVKKSEYDEHLEMFI